jgi:hypothetical protein
MTAITSSFKNHDIGVLRTSNPDKVSAGATLDLGLTEAHRCQDYFVIIVTKSKTAGANRVLREPAPCRRFDLFRLNNSRIQMPVGREVKGYDA